MAGNITVLPAKRTGFQEFSEAAQPYIQYAFQKILERQAQEQQRQQSFERTQQMIPGLFQPKAGANLTPQEQAMPLDQFNQYTQGVQSGQQQLQPRSSIPTKYKDYTLNMQTAQQYPGLDLESLGIPYKVPTTIGTMPIINISPEGKIEQVGTAPKGAKVITPNQMETPEKKEQRTVNKLVGETEGFIRQFERSYDELNKAYPNIGAKGFGGYTSRVIAGAGEKFGYFPETSTFLKEILPKANAMARTIEGGRITNEDRTIYADSFANALSSPNETNIRLMSNSLIEAQRKGGNISPILDIMQTSDNQVIQGILNQVTQRIETQQPTQQGWTPDKETRYQELLRKQRGG